MAKLNKKGRAMRDALIAVLVEFGIERWDEDHGGKHPCIIFMHNGRRWKHNFPASTSDVRAVKNAQAQLRNRLRREV